MSANGVLQQMSVAVQNAAERVSNEAMKSAATKLDLQIMARSFSAVDISVRALGIGVDTMIAAGKLQRACAMNSKTPNSVKSVGPLKNARHEAFAQFVANGDSATQAYASAYGRPSDAGTRASAHKLLTNANIRYRVDEFRREILQQAADAHCTIVAELEKMALEQIKAAHLRSACRTADDLPLNFHPAAIRASAGFTPSGAV